MENQCQFCDFKSLNYDFGSCAFCPLELRALEFLDENEMICHKIVRHGFLEVPPQLNCRLCTYRATDAVNHINHMKIVHGRCSAHFRCYKDRCLKILSLEYYPNHLLEFHPQAEQLQFTSDNMGETISLFGNIDDSFYAHSFYCHDCRLSFICASLIECNLCANISTHHYAGFVKVVDFISHLVQEHSLTFTGQVLCAFKETGCNFVGSLEEIKAHNLHQHRSCSVHICCSPTCSYLVNPLNYKTAHIKPNECQFIDPNTDAFKRFIEKFRNLKPKRCALIKTDDEQRKSKQVLYFQKNPTEIGRLFYSPVLKIPKPKVDYFTKYFAYKCDSCAFVAQFNEETTVSHHCCPFCHLVFFNLLEAKGHIAVYHRFSESETKTKCTDCQFTAESCEQILKHRLATHRFCKEHFLCVAHKSCNGLFSTSRKLSRHVFSQECSKGIDSEPNELSLSNQNVYTCSSCSFSQSLVAKNFVQCNMCNDHGKVFLIDEVDFSVHKYLRFQQDNEDMIYLQCADKNCAPKWLRLRDYFVHRCQVHKFCGLHYACQFKGCRVLMSSLHSVNMHQDICNKRDSGIRGDELTTHYLHSEIQSLVRTYSQSLVSVRFEKYACACCNELFESTSLILCKLCSFDISPVVFIDSTEFLFHLALTHKIDCQSKIDCQLTSEKHGCTYTGKVPDAYSHKLAKHGVCGYHVKCPFNDCNFLFDSVDNMLKHRNHTMHLPPIQPIQSSVAAVSENSASWASRSHPSSSMSNLALLKPENNLANDPPPKGQMENSGTDRPVSRRKLQSMLDSSIAELCRTNPTPSETVTVDINRDGDPRLCNRKLSKLSKFQERRNGSNALGTTELNRLTYDFKTLNWPFNDAIAQRSTADKVPVIESPQKCATSSHAITIEGLTRKTMEPYPHDAPAVQRPPIEMIIQNTDRSSFELRSNELYKVVDNEAERGKLHQAVPINMSVQSKHETPVGICRSSNEPDVLLSENMPTERFGDGLGLSPVVALDQLPLSMSEIINRLGGSKPQLVQETQDVPRKSEGSHQLTDQVLPPTPILQRSNPKKALSVHEVISQFEGQSFPRVFPNAATRANFCPREVGPVAGSRTPFRPRGSFQIRPPFADVKPRPEPRPNFVPVLMADNAKEVTEKPNFVGSACDPSQIEPVLDVDLRVLPEDQLASQADIDLGPFVSDETSGIFFGYILPLRVVTKTIVQTPNKFKFYKCSRCGLDKDVKAQLFIHHYICSNCELTFLCMFEAAYHLCNVHVKPFPKFRKGVKCEFCPFFAHDLSSWGNHRRNFHSFCVEHIVCAGSSCLTRNLFANRAELEEHIARQGCFKKGRSHKFDVINAPYFTALHNQQDFLAQQSCIACTFMKYKEFLGLKAVTYPSCCTAEPFVSNQDRDYHGASVHFSTSSARLKAIKHSCLNCKGSLPVVLSMLHKVFNHAMCSEHYACPNESCMLVFPSPYMVKMHHRNCIMTFFTFKQKEILNRLALTPPTLPPVTDEWKKVKISKCSSVSEISSSSRVEANQPSTSGDRSREKSTSSSFDFESTISRLRRESSQSSEIRDEKDSRSRKRSSRSTRSRSKSPKARNKSRWDSVDSNCVGSPKSSIDNFLKQARYENSK